MTFPIANSEVAKYHNYLTTIINDQSIPRDKRTLAVHKQRLLQLLVQSYEHGDDITFSEDYMWLEQGHPTLPEDIAAELYHAI